MKKDCTIYYCQSKHYARGFCKKHYAQHYRASNKKGIRQYQAYVSTAQRHNVDAITRAALIRYYKRTTAQPREVKRVEFSKAWGRYLIIGVGGRALTTIRPSALYGK